MRAFTFLKLSHDVSHLKSRDSVIVVSCEPVIQAKMDGVTVLAGVLFCMLYFAQDSSCHLCLISPPQRGSMNGLNKPGGNLLLKILHKVLFATLVALFIQLYNLID